MTASENNIKKLTKKQLDFCLEYVKCKNGAQAYRTAYDAQNMSNDTIKVKACNLLKKDNLRITIEEMQKKAQTHIEQVFTYDIIKSFEKLCELQNLAVIPRGKFQTLDISAAIRAEELKGKLYGLYIEKKEIDGKMTFSDFLDELEN